MAVNPSLPKCIFVIDTNMYAGNFEREMCAFITGQYGECEVGRGQAELAKSQLSDEILGYFENYVEQIADDHGCRRPASIWNLSSNPGYNSVAIFFYEDPSPEMVQLMKDRAVAFASSYPKYGVSLDILGFHLVSQKVTTTQQEV